MKLFGRPVDGVFGEDVQHDDDEEQEDAEEEPHVHHLDLGRLGQVVAGAGEERVEHQQRRQRHRHAHLGRGQGGLVSGARPRGIWRCLPPTPHPPHSISEPFLRFI